MCQFVKKKRKVLCLVEHMSTKKWPTLFFQPCTIPPTINNFYNVQLPPPPPYYSNPCPCYYSRLESKNKEQVRVTHIKLLQTSWIYLWQNFQRQSDVQVSVQVKSQGLTLASIFMQFRSSNYLMFFLRKNFTKSLNCVWHRQR